MIKPQIPHAQRSQFVDTVQRKSFGQTCRSMCFDWSKIDQWQTWHTCSFWVSLLCGNKGLIGWWVQGIIIRCKYWRITVHGIPSLRGLKEAGCRFLTWMYSKVHRQWSQTDLAFMRLSLVHYLFRIDLWNILTQTVQQSGSSKFSFVRFETKHNNFWGAFRNCRVTFSSMWYLNLISIYKDIYHLWPPTKECFPLWSILRWTYGHCLSWGDHWPRRAHENQNAPAAATTVSYHGSRATSGIADSGTAVAPSAISSRRGRGSWRPKSRWRDNRPPRTPS